MAGVPLYGKRTGFTSALKLLIKLCGILDKFEARIRAFVPPEKHAEFDVAAGGVRALCAILKAVDRFRSDVNDPS